MSSLANWPPADSRPIFCHCSIFVCFFYVYRIIHVTSQQKATYLLTYLNTTTRYFPHAPLITEITPCLLNYNIGRAPDTAGNDWEETDHGPLVLCSRETRRPWTDVGLVLMTDTDTSASSVCPGSGRTGRLRCYIHPTTLWRWRTFERYRRRGGG